MSSSTPDSPYASFISNFATQLDVGAEEARALASRLSAAPVSPDDADLDHLELLLAVSVNARLRDLSTDQRFLKLKFMLRNNSSRAVRAANSWVENRITFEDLLASV